jgi:hypothetical protein
MTYPADPNASGKRRVYYAFLVAPLAYVALILLLKYQIGWKPLYPFTEVFYLSLVYALIELAMPLYLKNSMWQKRKTAIHSPKEFYSAFFAVSVVSLAFAESIGIIGLLVYELSGDLFLPISLNVISIFGVAIYFPRQQEIDEKIREFHFEG